MMLTACAADVRVKPQPIHLPALPAAERADCAQPGLKAGDQAKIALARHRVALADCAARHARVVRFYDGVKRRFERK